LIDLNDLQSLSAAALLHGPKAKLLATRPRCDSPIRRASPTFHSPAGQQVARFGKHS